MPTAFDPNTWYGDTEELLPFIELLAESADLCEETFLSKQEAFCAGLWLGPRQPKSTPD